MKAGLVGSIFVACLVAGAAAAQERTQSTQAPKDGPGGREPPPQAYEDCKGKKAGDTVQHSTPEGKVAATCADSPKGLVARPSKPKGAEQDVKTPQR